MALYPSFLGWVDLPEPEDGRPVRRTGDGTRVRRLSVPRPRPSTPGR